MTTIAAMDVWDVIRAYGADADILAEYHCIPLRARMVRDVLKLRTSTGSVALKKVTAAQNRLEYAHQCLEHVAKSGLNNVPRFIRTRYGDPYVTQANDDSYYMTVWLSGKELDVHKPEEFLQGTQVLAQWHTVAKGFRPRAVSTRGPQEDDAWLRAALPFQERLQRTLAELGRYYEVSKARAEDTPFERFYVSCAEELSHRLTDAINSLRKCRFAETDRACTANGWVCHGDFTRHNVTTDGESFTVWNYERIHPGTPLLDLALYLHRYMPSYDWDVSLLEEAYESYTNGGVHGAGDVETLVSLLSVPLRTVQVVSWYYQKARDWDDEDFVDALEAALQLDSEREHAVQEAFAHPVEIPVIVMGDNEEADVPVPNVGHTAQQLPLKYASNLPVELAARDIDQKRASRVGEELGHQEDPSEARIREEGTEKDSVDHAKTTTGKSSAVGRPRVRRRKASRKRDQETEKSENLPRMFGQEVKKMRDNT